MKPFVMQPSLQDIMKQYGRENKSAKAKGEISSELRRKQYESVVSETIREIYGNARYWEFFSSFNEESVHDFITEYATKKAWYLVNGERAMANKTSDQFKFRDLAERCFWEIQQKKLFNLQVEWRAGIIEIEGIEVTRDFLCWEHAISRCTFLEPVNKTDLNLYLEYLDSGKFCEKGWLYYWQDYDTYYNHAVPHSVTPAWYTFYDEKRGTGYLRLLPDKRGEDEKRYLNAWKNNSINQKEEDLNADDMFSGPGPLLYMNYQSLEFFISTFENKTLLSYFQNLESKPEDTIREAELQEALRILNKAHEPIKLPESPDWRSAIILGARQYKIQQIKSNLQTIFDEYRFRLKTGIAWNGVHDDCDYDEHLYQTQIYKKQLASGKMLLETTNKQPGNTTNSNGN